MGFLPRHSERPFLFTASGAASFHGSIKPQKKNDPAAESLTKNLRFLSGASQHTFRVAPLPAHLGKPGQCHPVQHIVHRVIHLFPQPARGALLRPRSFRRVLCKARYRSKVSLRQPQAGEQWLKEQGFPIVRLRVHGDILRIEIDKERFSDFIAMADKITAKMKELGFVYITLDAEGFRSGSMDVHIVK